MDYFTYKITFRDLPGYFYYGRHKYKGKPYFGSPKTWSQLWEQFEPEIQILQWYETAEEVDEAETAILKATWKEKYSLNEHAGNCFSEEDCRKSAQLMNRHPNTIESRKKSGEKMGPKNWPAMNSHPNTITSRSENGRKIGPETVKAMNAHPNTSIARQGLHQEEYEDGRSVLAVRMAEETNKNRRLPVLCVETGVSYSSSCEASKKVGGRAAHIRRACKTGGRAGGLHWRFL